MRSHRLVITLLALGASAAVAGCGTGRGNPTFGADPSAPGASGVQAAAPAPAPQPAAPVVIAGPDQKVVAERDAASAAAARSADAAAKAEQRRKDAAKELEDERAKAARARRRAAAREAFLRQALAAQAKARQRAPATQAATSGPAVATPQHSAPISASDTSGNDLIADRDRRSDAESRAAVVRFHELLDARDARACDMLSPRMLTSVYGTDPGAIDRCRAGVEAIDQRVSVVIAESRAHGKRAVIAVVSRLGDTEVRQTLRLVLVDGTWLIDGAQRAAS